MATAPVLDPIESRSIEQDAATLGFQRLEGVRTRQRARRRRRLILVTTLVVAVAGIGVLGFTSERNRRGHSQPSVHADTPEPATATATTRSPISPPTVLLPPQVDEGTRDVPPRVDEGKRDARLRVDEGRRDVPPPARSRVHRPRDNATTSAHGEPADADPTAAIDWLLKTSRTAGH